MLEEKKHNYNPKSLSNLKMIQPGEVRNPNGRPKSMLKKVLDEAEKTLDIRMSKTDVANISSLVNQMTVSEIRRIASDCQTPGFIAVIANAILGDINNGEMKNTAFLLEFQHGKASQAINIETKIKENTVNPKIMSDDEIRERISKLRDRDITEGDFEEVV